MIRQAFAPHRFRIDTNQAAGPALRDLMIPHRLERHPPPLFGCRHRLPGRSFNTALSSMVSAKSRLILPFLSSRLFGRLASDTSMP